MRARQSVCEASKPYRFASGDLEDFGRKADRALDAKLLVLGAVDEIGRDWGTT